MAMPIFGRIAALAALLALAGCGSGGGGSDSSAGGDGTVGVAPAFAPNVLAITIDGGPPGVNAVNVPYVNVTVCSPGTTQCQTVDHVLVDTGSAGLRIVASVLNSSLLLPPQTDGNGNNLAECAVFFDGFSWGAVRIADVVLASQTAGSIPIQLIGDPAFPSVPASCSGTAARAKNTVQGLSANGILGVGPFLQDCGAACARTAIAGTYYICPQGGCQPVVTSLARQVPNPVARLPVDNNGVIIELPALPASGASRVIGALTLGIGTAGNNALGSAAKFDLDRSGNFRTTYNGRTSTAFVDSGSNGFFFPDPGIPTCSTTSPTPSFYCPPATLALTASIQGATNGQTQGVSFSVADATALISNAPTFKAFNNLGGPSAGSTSFDWGIPFFFGRRVFTAIEGQNTPAGAGPYIAF